MDKRTPHQSDQAVSEGLCCNRKKKYCSLLLGQKTHFFYHWEKQKISDQTAASPAEAPAEGIPVPGWAPGPSLPWAQPLPLLALLFSLSLPGTASDWKINKTLMIKKEKFFNMYFLYDWQCFQEELLWWQSSAILNVLPSPFLENKSPCSYNTCIIKKPRNNNPTGWRLQKGIKNRIFHCLYLAFYLFSISNKELGSFRFNFQSPAHVLKGTQSTRELASCLSKTTCL